MARSVDEAELTEGNGGLRLVIVGDGALLPAVIEGDAVRRITEWKHLLQRLEIVGGEGVEPGVVQERRGILPQGCGNPDTRHIALPVIRGHVLGGGLAVAAGWIVKEQEDATVAER